MTFENPRADSTLIVLHATSPQEGQFAHFRNVVAKNTKATLVNDTVKEARFDKLQHGITYYFHDHVHKGLTTKVVSTRYPDLMKDGDYKTLDGFTGINARAIR